MLTPAYAVTIGKKKVDTTSKPQASTMVDMTVMLDMDTPADSFALELGNVDGLHPARDDDALIELGYADNGGLTQVMTAAVVSVEPNLTTTRVIGASVAQALLHSFADFTYESKSAGEIVKDLAGKAGVDVDATDDGIDFPAYVVHGRRSFYHHMRDLADLCGFDLYVNADGKLIFQEFTGGNTLHVLEYAKHILALDVLHTPPVAGQVQTWGESPAGSGGENSWAWLTKDFSNAMGSAGSGDPTLLIEEPALRTGDAARTAADATHTRIEGRTLRGWLLTLGNPKVQLGDALELRSMPDSALNTSFQVRSVTHRIHKRRGFTTGVGFRAMPT